MILLTKQNRSPLRFRFPNCCWPKCRRMARMLWMGHGPESAVLSTLISSAVFKVGRKIWESKCWQMFADTKQFHAWGICACGRGWEGGDGVEPRVALQGNIVAEKPVSRVGWRGIRIRDRDYVFLVFQQFAQWNAWQWAVCLQGQGRICDSLQRRRRHAWQGWQFHRRVI